MTVKLFIALYVGLIVGMFILLFTNFPVGWVFFGFLFVTAWGGIMLINRPYIIAALFLLASLIVLGTGLLAIQHSRQINTWPTASGVITRSSPCNYAVNNSVAHYSPCIEYRYRINDQTFEASSTDTGEFAQLWWSHVPDNYQEGREVKVYYDPSNPEISRLVADISSQDWITTIIGAIMAVLSAFTLLWVLFSKGTSQTVAPVSLPDG
jgi:hypothetical protein